MRTIFGVGFGVGLAKFIKRFDSFFSIVSVVVFLFKLMFLLFKLMFLLFSSLSSFYQKICNRGSKLTG